MRPTALFAACGASLAVAGVVSIGASVAAQAAAPGPAADAGGFLARELDRYGGVLPYPGTDQGDPGLTIDAVLGMLATGVGPEQAQTAAGAVASELGSYLGAGIAPTELYAGPVAKAVLLAAATGGDPHTFAGRDLVADLAALAGADGHYADRTAYGDTSNTFTQALGILATARVAGVAPAKPVGFLLDQQCSDGGFRLYLTAGDCVSDPDPTALAVVALRGTGEQAAAERALRYLQGRMDAAGGLAGGTGASTPNSNTTGLAAMAFAVSGQGWSDAARSTQDFLRSLQFGCDANESLRGAVAYDATTYAAALTSAAPAGDQERRASAQAALGLAGVSLADVSVDGAVAPAPACSGPSSTSTTPSGSSSSPSGTSSTPPASSSTSGEVTHTITATVTRTAQPAAPAPAVRTVTVTAPPATATATRTVTVSPAPAGQASGSADGPASSASTGPGSDTGTAVVAAAPASGDGGSSGGPLAIAGALVLLGAAGAGAILRRGRTH